ncbi:MAG TPA: hypothetical protein VN207_04860 [Ktedonobacteraceae bacterium]|nr:hypothetical protein [Ktedonobacteraceae bacterium]
MRGAVFERERLNPTALAGDGGLDEDIRRYYLLSTDLTPLHLVNPGVLERHAGPRTRR